MVSRRLLQEPGGEMMVLGLDWWWGGRRQDAVGLGISSIIKGFHLVWEVKKQHLCCIDVAVLCYAKSLQPCPTLCNTIDVSPPGSSVCGILQARIPEWVAISSSEDKRTEYSRT